MGVKIPVLALLIAVLVIGGCSSSPSANDRRAGVRGDSGTTTSEATTDGAPPQEEEEAAEQKDRATLVHRAEPENVEANSTYLDHPLANGNPGAVVFATQARSADGGADNAHPIGVWYDANRERWAIFNQDREPMPEGAAFDVSVLRAPSKTSDATGADGAVFVHRADSGNVVANSTYLDDPLANGNPDAFVSITPSWNPGGGPGVYDDHPVGVWYDANRQKWAIYNQDRAPMPEGAAFNVSVSERASGGSTLVHRATPGNTEGDSTYVKGSFARDPDAALLVTPNWNPGGGAGTYDDHPVGVRYDAGRGAWAIRNEDGAPMPEGAAFNVVKLPAGETADSASKAGDERPARSEEPAPAEKTRAPIEAGVDQYALKDVPKYRDFFAEGDARVPEKLLPKGSSAGAIPAVKPFNFGRDPGGPEDRTLYLTIPKLGITGVPVYDAVSEEKLRESAVHVPATGYPWQKGANVFIAGHRIGYPNTGSYYLFFNLDDLVEGDQIVLEDSAGGRYVYRVTKRMVVGPEDVESMNPVDGKSVVSLQTCTLPDYKKRLIVRGKLVEETRA